MGAFFVSQKTTVIRSDCCLIAGVRINVVGDREVCCCCSVDQFSVVRKYPPVPPCTLLGSTFAVLCTARHSGASLNAQQGLAIIDTFQKRKVAADADGESPRKARSHHDVWSKLPADVRESAETPATSSTATSSGGYELHASQKHALHAESPPSSSWWQEKVRVMSDSGTSKC